MRGSVLIYFTRVSLAFGAGVYAREAPAAAMAVVPVPCEGLVLLYMETAAAEKQHI